MPLSPPHAPCALQAEDLIHAEPVEVVVQICEGDEVPLVMGPPWPRFSVAAPGRWVEEQREVALERGLVRADDRQVVAARRADLAAEIALAEVRAPMSTRPRRACV